MVGGGLEDQPGEEKKMLLPDEFLSETLSPPFFLALY
jgi:hypothetical protein